MFRSLAIAGLLVGVPVAALAVTPPYNTTVAGGDIGSARLVFGDQAAAGIRDALPAFTDVDAYESYYESADDENCDDSCLRPVYELYKGQGRMRMLMIGTRFHVRGAFTDPDDRKYSICKVQLRDGSSSRTWLVLCFGLKDFP